MPAWLLKVGMSVAEALLGDDLLKRLVQGTVILVLLMLALVLSLPALVAHIPLVAAGKITEFFDKAGQTGESYGIDIPWEEVVAAWAVKNEQDFTRANERQIQRLAEHWAERHEREEVHTVGEYVWTEIHVWYTLRDFQEVMDLLGFTPEQRDLAERYLVALREGGLRPPPGWRARPSFGWAWPVPGYDTAEVITSPFGFRIHPVTGKPGMHQAVDIAAPEGTPVVAALAGTVTEIGNDFYLGRYLLVKGGGYETKYSHLSAIAVQQGQKVEAGQVIGKVGNTGVSTGPHLDFAVRVTGQWQNPLQYF